MTSTVFQQSPTDTRPCLVLLPGWGSDRRIWEPLLSGLVANFQVKTLDLPGIGDFRNTPWETLDDILAIIDNQITTPAIVAGWSLGGMLATAFAGRFPEKVLGLVTLSTNLRFVADSQWPEAMDQATFIAFSESVNAAPANALKRFYSLQTKSDANARKQLQWLRQNALVDADLSALSPLLDILSTIDNRQHWSHILQPGLHLFGECDPLVPAAVVPLMAALNPQQQCHIFSERGHLLHYPNPADIAEKINAFAASISEGCRGD